MHSHIHTPEYLYWWQQFLPHTVMGGKFGCDSQSAVLCFVLSEPVNVTKLYRKPPRTTFCSWWLCALGLSEFLKTINRYPLGFEYHYSCRLSNHIIEIPPQKCHCFLPFVYLPVCVLFFMLCLDFSHLFYWETVHWHIKLPLKPCLFKVWKPSSSPAHKNNNYIPENSVLICRCLLMLIFFICSILAVCQLMCVAGFIC